MPGLCDLCYGRPVTMPREVQSNKNNTGEVSSTSGHHDSHFCLLPGSARAGQRLECGDDATNIAPTDVGNVKISKLMKSEGRS